MNAFKNIFEKYTGIAELKEQNIQLQQSLSLTLSSLESKSNDHRGNPYTNVKKMIAALSQKYKGIAQWGNQIANNIISVRGTFTMGSGLSMVKSPEATDKDIEFVKNFLEHNELAKYMAIEIAKEAEIEGRTLLKLRPNHDNKQIDVRHIAYTQHGYKVNTDDEDYLDYKNVTYKINNDGRDETLERDEFVFRKFGGRLSEVNDATPKSGQVLANMENLDKALWDLRKIDKLFASPTPVLEFETAKAAAEGEKKLRGSKNSPNWKIGKLLITSGKFDLVGYDGKGVDNILKEIETHVKIISGQTGVPVHFMGFVDLINARATADSLIEFLEASTSKERQIWQSAYNELIYKAMEMSNKEFNTGYNLGSITINIPFETKGRMKEIEEVWLPMYLANTITLETFLSKVPDVEGSTEKEKIRKEQLEEAQNIYKGIDTGEEE